RALERDRRAKRMMYALKRAVKRAANLAGYDIQRLHALATPSKVEIVREINASVDYDPWMWLRSAYQFRSLLDIGANKGDYGAFIADFLKLERAYFFEPQIACLEQIKAHTAKLRHAEILSYALSDQEGEVTFHVTNQNPSSSMLPLGDASKTEFPE